MVLEDKQGRQQAHLAAIRNHRNILEFLYEKGVELDCTCNLGKLPLHYAAQHGCKFLLIIFEITFDQVKNLKQGMI